MDDSFVIIDGSLLLRFCYSNGWQPCYFGRQYVVEIIILIDGSLAIMEGSFLSRFLELQWMVALSLWKVVYCRDFCYSNRWQPCNYGRQSVVEIFVTSVDYSLVIMKGSLLLRFCYSNGWQPCHYGKQFVEIFLPQWMVFLSLQQVVCC